MATSPTDGSNNHQTFDLDLVMGLPPRSLVVAARFVPLARGLSSK